MRRSCSPKTHVDCITFEHHTKWPSDKDGIGFVEGMAARERHHRSTLCVKHNTENLALPQVRVPPHDHSDKH